MVNSTWNTKIAIFNFHNFIRGKHDDSGPEGVNPKIFMLTHLNRILDITQLPINIGLYHDDVIKWKHFPRYWPFVRRIHRSPVNSPHKGQ